MAEEEKLIPLIPISRGEFMARVGLLREIDPVTVAAYRFVEELEAQGPNRGHGRGSYWHQSFHGSSFPGDDDKACSRAQLYSLLDFPKGMFNKRGRQFTDAGKDFERQLVKRWHRSGMLVSPPPWQEQLQFERKEAWLTCSVDAITVSPRSIQPVCVEVKNVFAETINDMRNLITGPDPKHVRQVKCQIALANAFGPMTVKRCHNTGRLSIDSYVIDDYKIVNLGGQVCPEHMHTSCLEDVTLEPVRHGWLYYVSRDDMEDTYEYYFELDEDFLEQGVSRLEFCKQSFIDDTLPQTNFVKEGDKGAKFAHPFGWRWTYQPCKWCSYGDVCREDMKSTKKSSEHVRLSESAAIELARDINPDYDLQEVKGRIAKRWPEDRAMIESAGQSTNSKEVA